jgi:predicted RNA-binding Zn-ribbon protein involved in translation (DUF1610 family)
MLRRRRHHEDLLACPRCASRLVQPLTARRRRAGDWYVQRACPECGWRGAARCSAEAYADLDAAQRAARAALTTLLSRVERARLRGEAGWVPQGLWRDDTGPPPG